jgi:AcrR family transcriptional regulator
LAVSKSTKTRRHPPSVRRALILEAARVCIEERGLARTTVRDIASASGVAVGTITYHFASVDEILVEVLQTACKDMDTLYDQAKQCETAAAGLRFLIDNNVPDHPRSRKFWRLWLDYWAVAARDRRLGALQNERYRIYRSVVEDIVRTGIANGEFRTIEVADFAHTFIGLFDGLGLHIALDDDDLRADQVRALLLASVEEIETK